MSTAFETLVEFKKVVLSVDWPSAMVDTYTVPANRWAKVYLHRIQFSSFPGHNENLVIGEVPITNSGQTEDNWPLDPSTSQSILNSRSFIDNEIRLIAGDTIVLTESGTGQGDVWLYIEEYNIP